MIAIGDMQAAPSAQLALIAVVEPLQAMEIVQVPRDRCMLTVDLQRVQRLVAPGVAGGLKRRQRSVAEPRQEKTRVVDPDRLHPPREIVLALLDEGLGDGGDFVDPAVQPYG